MGFNSSFIKLQQHYSKGGRFFVDATDSFLGSLRSNYQLHLHARDIRLDLSHALTCKKCICLGLASFPGLHAQLLLLAVRKAGRRPGRIYHMMRAAADVTFSLLKSGFVLSPSLFYP